tara:strand:- start:724 stop:5220 length:4497 start_codon:yes stop_codon:yes gene_type:complete
MKPPNTLRIAPLVGLDGSRRSEEDAANNTMRGGYNVEVLDGEWWTRPGLQPQNSDIDPASTLIKADSTLNTDYATGKYNNEVGSIGDLPFWWAIDFGGKNECLIGNPWYLLRYNLTTGQVRPAYRTINRGLLEIGPDVDDGTHTAGSLADLGIDQATGEQECRFIPDKPDARTFGRTNRAGGFDKAEVRDEDIGIDVPRFTATFRGVSETTNGNWDHTPDLYGSALNKQNTISHFRIDGPALTAVPRGTVFKLTSTTGNTAYFQIKDAATGDSAGDDTCDLLLSVRYLKLKDGTSGFPEADPRTTALTFQDGSTITVSALNADRHIGMSKADMIANKIARQRLGNSSLAANTFGSVDDGKAYHFIERAAGSAHYADTAYPSTEHYTPCAKTALAAAVNWTTNNAGYGQGTANAPAGTTYLGDITPQTNYDLAGFRTFANTNAFEDPDPDGTANDLYFQQQNNHFKANLPQVGDLILIGYDEDAWASEVRVVTKSDVNQYRGARSTAAEKSHNSDPIPATPYDTADAGAGGALDGDGLSGVKIKVHKAWDRLTRVSANGNAADPSTWGGIDYRRGDKPQASDHAVPYGDPAKLARSDANVITIMNNLDGLGPPQLYWSAAYNDAPIAGSNVTQHDGILRDAGGGAWKNAFSPPQHNCYGVAGGSPIESQNPRRLAREWEAFGNFGNVVTGTSNATGGWDSDGPGSGPVTTSTDYQGHPARQFNPRSILWGQGKLRKSRYKRTWVRIVRPFAPFTANTQVGYNADSTMAGHELTANTVAEDTVKNPNSLNLPWQVSVNTPKVFGADTGGGFVGTLTQATRTGATNEVAAKGIAAEGWPFQAISHREDGPIDTSTGSCVIFEQLVTYNQNALAEPYVAWDDDSNRQYQFRGPSNPGAQHDNEKIHKGRPYLIITSKHQVPTAFDLVDFSRSYHQGWFKNTATSPATAIYPEGGSWENPLTTTSVGRGEFCAVIKNRLVIGKAYDDEGRWPLQTFWVSRHGDFTKWHVGLAGKNAKGSYFTLDDHQNEIKAIAPLGSSLVIHRAFSQDIVSPTESARVPVSIMQGRKGDGLISARSLIVTNKGHFLWTQTGPAFFDGQTLQPIGDTIRAQLRSMFLYKIGHRNTQNSFNLAASLGTVQNVEGEGPLFGFEDPTRRRVVWVAKHGIRHPAVSNPETARQYLWSSVVATGDTTTSNEKIQQYSTLELLGRWYNPNRVAVVFDYQNQNWFFYDLPCLTGAGVIRSGEVGFERTGEHKTFVMTANGVVCPWDKDSNSKDYQIVPGTNTRVDTTITNVSNTAKLEYVDSLVETGWMNFGSEHRKTLTRIYIDFRALSLGHTKLVGTAPVFDAFSDSSYRESDFLNTQRKIKENWRAYLQEQKSTAHFGTLTIYADSKDGNSPAQTVDCQITMEKMQAYKSDENRQPSILTFELTPRVTGNQFKFSFSNNYTGAVSQYTFAPNEPSSAFPSGESVDIGPYSAPFRIAGIEVGWEDTGGNRLRYPANKR